MRSTAGSRDTPAKLKPTTRRVVTRWPNYRSTKPIVHCADGVCERKRQRMKSGQAIHMNHARHASLTPSRVDPPGRKDRPVVAGTVRASAAIAYRPSASMAGPGSMASPQCVSGSKA
jgi:hypothetical protein